MGCVRSALDGAPCCPAGNRSRQMQGPGRAYRQTLSVLAVAAPVAGECRESYKMAFVRSQMVIVSSALGGASSLLGNRSCQGQGVNGTSRQNLSGLAVAAPAADECRESWQTGSVRSALAGAVLELGQRRRQTPQVTDTCWAVDPRLARFGRQASVALAVDPASTDEGRVRCLLAAATGSRLQALAASPAAADEGQARLVASAPEGTCCQTAQRSHSNQKTCGRQSAPHRKPDCSGCRNPQALEHRSHPTRWVIAAMSAETADPDVSGLCIHVAAPPPHRLPKGAVDRLPQVRNSNLATSVP